MYSSEVSFRCRGCGNSTFELISAVAKTKIGLCFADAKDEFLGVAAVPNLRNLAKLATQGVTKVPS